MSDSIFNQQRVLVLEDEPIISMLVEQMLEDAGAVVDCHATLAAAEAAVAAARPDMALLDVNIHNETSYALAAHLADLRVPVIFATGYGVGAHPDAFAQVPTVSKPYDLTQITAAFEQAISAA